MDAHQAADQEAPVAVKKNDSIDFFQNALYAVFIVCNHLFVSTYAAQKK